MEGGREGGIDAERWQQRRTNHHARGEVRERLIVAMKEIFSSITQERKREEERELESFYFFIYCDNFLNFLFYKFIY